MSMNSILKGSFVKNIWRIGNFMRILDVKSNQTNTPPLPLLPPLYHALNGALHFF